MPIGYYLQDKLRIWRLPGSQWIAELDKLSPEARAEVEPFLREQAKLLRIRKQYASQSGNSALKNSNTRKR
jgi:hypothetical protein